MLNGDSILVQHVLSKSTEHAFMRVGRYIS